MNAYSTDQYQDSFRLAENAAEWLLRLETEGHRCHAAFVAWLKTSPEHVREFLAVTHLSRRLDGVDPQRRFDIERLLTLAQANVVELESAMEPPRQPLNRSARHWRMAAMLAIASTILALSWQWLAPRMSGTQTYTTAVGEQRNFKLPDGSLIYLNTRSRAAVHFSRSLREIRLLEGEALIVVERDSARPFRVIAGSTAIQALGTQFNVYRRSGGTRVSVIEGKVRVARADRIESPSAGPAERLLSAGEGADVARNGHIVGQPAAGLATAIAWRERRLVFQDDTLATLAEEFNRYNSRQIRIEGAAVNSKLLTGSFNADNLQGLLRFLRRDTSLVIEEREDAVIIKARETASTKPIEDFVAR